MRIKIGDGVPENVFIQAPNSCTHAVSDKFIKLVEAAFGHASSQKDGDWAAVVAQVNELVPFQTVEKVDLQSVTFWHKETAFRAGRWR